MTAHTSVVQMLESISVGEKKLPARSRRISKLTNQHEEGGGVRSKEETDSTPSFLERIIQDNDKCIGNDMREQIQTT